MNVYLDDTLLALSLIGAPVIFGALLYYGLTTSTRGNHDTGEEKRRPDIQV